MTSADEAVYDFQMFPKKAYLMTYEKLLNYAFRILSKKRYTSFEMRKKLEEYGKRRVVDGRSDRGECEKFGRVLTCEKFGEAALKGFDDASASDGFERLVVAVLDRLKELEYLDDEQYAQDFVADRIKFKPRGEFLLRRELKLKGISKELIGEIFRDGDISEGGISGGEEFNELAVCLDALVRKERQWRDITINKKKEKAVRFLASRGFKPDAIYKVVNSRYNFRRE